VAARVLRRGRAIAASRPTSKAGSFRKLQMIDDATSDQDLRVPPSNHFEKLRGNLAGFHSIRVNSQWRLVFRWDGSRGEAEGVYLDDHSCT
jgi:proteic killer suppression protein